MKRARTGTVIHRTHDDDGVSAILVSLFVIFLLIPVSAISIDVSSAFSNRRQMQNAADASAQAGVQVMQSVFQGTAQASALDTLVKDVAAKNGADTISPYYSCNVATVQYDPIQVDTGPACADWAGDGAYNAVTVHTQRTIDTFFARAIIDPASSTSAGASATATIQRAYDPDLGNAIFAMCAYDDTGNGHNSQPDPSWIPLLVDGGSGQLVLNTGQATASGTPTAVGHKYVVWSNAGGNSNLSRCGLQSASFDGLICGLADPPCGQPITLPNWLAISTGAHVGPTLATMAGYPTCQASTFSGLNGPTTFQPCAMVLPVCDSSNGDTGTNGQLHCVAFGEFFLSPGDQNNNDSSCTFISGSSATICAKFLGEPLLAGGTPLAGDPGPGDAIRIALVQ